MRQTNIFLLLTIGTIFNTFGQKNTRETPPDFPMDSTTGKITYTEVVKVDSTATKDELYSRAREWFAKAYKSSTNVIQMEDKESGKIVGKALTQVFYQAMKSNYSGGYFHYTISIYIKDGRYKYEVTDFYHTGQASPHVPDYGTAESMINSKDKTMGIAMQKYYNYYLYQLDIDIRGLIADLKAAMTTKASGAKSDDW